MTNISWPLLNTLFAFFVHLGALFLIVLSALI